MTTVTNEINEITVTVTEIANQYHVTIQQTGGIPLGGTTGQILAKASDLNKDVVWVDQATTANADWDAVSGVAEILNKPILGTAAAADTTDFATAAQGVTADSALTLATVNAKEIEVVVKEASQLTGVLDPMKVYFLDGIIDMGSTSIEVPTGGLNIQGATFDTSKLISSEPNYTLFTSPVGGSGNLLLANLAVEVTGTSSKVFALTSDTGNEAIEIVRINYNNCTSLGYIDNYRQLLEDGTGRFGGSPELEFRGAWNGARLTTSIARGMTIPTSLFKAGSGLTFSGRFITDINCDLPATGALINFAFANFINNETLKINNAFITRLGEINSSDSTISPNITHTSVKSFWQNNVGVQNTHKYIQARISTEVATSIALASTYYNLAGTYTISDVSHFSMPTNGIFELLSGNGRYAVTLNYQLEGTANDVFSIQVAKSTNGGVSYSPVDHKIAKVQNLVGNEDIGVLGSTFNLDLKAGDRLKLEIENYTGGRNLTAKIDSSITIINL